MDAEVVGLPIAQVALAFGADELVTPLRSSRLEVYGEGEQAVLRERELAALVRSAGREPIVVAGTVTNGPLGARPPPPEEWR